ncbi:MAG: FHA domain-containing protein [Acidobacteriota bacterium]
MAYQLLFRSPTGERVVRLEAPLVVGRDPACDVVVDSVRVSRKHAEFMPSHDGVSIRDLGSRNGVIINGVRVEQGTIGPADRVLLGDVSVIVQAVGAGAPPPALRVDQPRAPWGAGAAPFPPPPGPPAGAGEPAAFGQDAPAPPFPSGIGSNPFGAPVAPSPFGQAPVAAPPAAPGAGWAASAAADAMPDRTTILPAGGHAGPAPAASRARPAVTAGPRRSLFGRLGLGSRITVLFTLAALGATLTGAVPILIARSSALNAATRLRAATIARALALEAGPALATGQNTALSIGAAMAEPGVRQALILSPSGRVLAPPQRLDETLTELPLFGPVASLQGAQTAMEGRTAHATVVIDSAGRHVGVVWVLVDPSYQSTGSGSGLSLIAAILAALVLGYGAAHVVRKMVWGHLQTLATDIDLASSGQLASVSDPFGVPRLAESLNFIVGRLRTAPNPPAGPHPSGPSLPAPGGRLPVTRSEGMLVLNTAYVIQDARGAAADLVESTQERLTGHHVIEAIADQVLVGAILDCVSELGSRDAATRQVEGTATRPPLELQAKRAPDGTIHVSLAARG